MKYNFSLATILVLYNISYSTLPECSSILRNNIIWYPVSIRDLHALARTQNKIIVCYFCVLTVLRVIVIVTQWSCEHMTI